MTNTDPRRRMLPIVAMALFIDSMGIGIILPVAPKLVMELTGLPLAEAAPIGGWLTFAYAIMQFICSPILGNISDRFGRKPVLMASLAALSVDYVLMGLAPTITWLFVGRIIAGIAGATFATANAVVADVIPAEQRAKFFGMNGAAWGMGFIVGPVVGGLLGQYGSRVPFFAAAVFTALNFTIALFVLRETLSESNRRAFALRRANVFGALRSLRVIPGALLLLCTLFMYQIGHDTLPSSWAWVTMGKFGWGEREVGLSLAVLGLGTAVVGPLLWDRLQRSAARAQPAGAARLASRGGVADLELDLLRRRVTRGGNRIDLTAKEFGLLELLMRRQGEVLPRSLIASQVWDMNFDSDTNVIEVAMRRLRLKVDDGQPVKLIQTVRGMGYVLEVPQEP